MHIVAAVDDAPALIREIPDFSLKAARHLSTFLGEKFWCEHLLNSRAVHVFLVAEDALDVIGDPFLLARDRQNMPRSQLIGLKLRR